MKAFVGITDSDWFSFLSSRPEIDEVNFWQPSGGKRFRAKEEFENGRDYYRLQGPIRTPTPEDWAPAAEFLEWHANNVFRG